MSALPEPTAMSRTALLDELALYLRPPGQGIYAVSTGKAALEEATRSYLGGVDSNAPWRRHLETIADPDVGVALLGVPSDVGAGIVRGAAWGPTAIRRELGSAPVLDLGDVFTIPHLIEDEACSTAQLERSREAMYAGVMAPFRRGLPVSPISVTRRVYALLAALDPDLKIMLLGGDHTVTWPAMAELLQGGPTRNEDVGIVHFDAHTDLMPERLGVEHCFATWAWHANQLLGGGQRLIQLGIRASGKDRAHWERTEDVRQVWAHEALEMGPEALASLVAEHLESIDVQRVYVSNDLDGTDAYWAAACGTPEPDGLTPDHVLAVLEALKGRFAVFGADLVELAPGLSLDREAADRSAKTATRYVRKSLELLESSKS